MKKITIILIFLFGFFGNGFTQTKIHQSEEPPVVPIGEQAYLQWDKLPYQRIGIRAYMRSTYDRKGNNRSADASNYLYQESDSFNVTLDVKGNGILYFVRTNHFHGSPWNYEVDGNNLIVKETATDVPVDAKNKYEVTEFIPRELFPNPLTWTWSTTKGADLMWRPISFEDSFRLAYGRTFYGTGYYIYHLFPKGLKHTIPKNISWKKDAPDKKVLDLINQSGTDIAPKGEGVKALSGVINASPLESDNFCNISDSPSMVRAIKFSVPKEKAADFGNCRIKVTWDKRWYASIDVPIDLFFGSGELYNNNDREFVVKGFPSNIQYKNDSVHLACYWPMPFFRNAKFEIEERNGKTLDGVRWEIRTVPYEDPVNHVAYFHATYTDHEFPVDGKDLTFLDTRQTEGGGDWSGHFVGMSWIFTHEGHLGTLEGDPRFFFDDSQTPQGWGTGTEEWGGGGDYWGGLNMTIPFAGHPIGKNIRQMTDNDVDAELLNSAYRFLIADFFPFGKNAVINLEHGGLNTYPEHYSGVAYWYGIDAPTLVLTDQLNVCNKKDIEVHNYTSPTAGEPYALTSRYEWGPDTDLTKDWSHPQGKRENTYESKLYFTAQQDSVRIMKGISQFTVSLHPDNLGVMLRRKFDYLYPNQHANVYVRAEGTTDWNFAGEWFTAGSVTYYFSYPKGKAFMEDELKKTNPEILTSNRRWREEEFLIAEELTKGIEKLEVKIEFIPNEKQLLPGIDYPAESAWSEARYWVYCYSMPKMYPEIHKGAYNEMLLNQQ